MKKLFVYLFVLLVLGGIFGLAIHQTGARYDNQVIGSVLDIIMPAVAFADSDTIQAPKPPAPPPPID